MFSGLAFAVSVWAQQPLSSRQERSFPTKTSVSSIFADGLPAGILVFDPSNGRSGNRDLRLAVLQEPGIKVYSLDSGGALTEECSVASREPLDWEVLRAFPTTRELVGSVLFSSDEYSYAVTTIILYEAGKCRAVFEGYDTDFVDIDFDGIPEIIGHKAYQKEKDKLVLWTWDGTKYVEVGSFYRKDIYGESVREALTRVRKKTH
jgi:hypothetical protein